MKKITKILIGLGVIILIIIGLAMIKQPSYQESSELEKLQALPYVSSTEEIADEQKTGVVKYDYARAYPGYNLFADFINKAYLIDMQGEIVHQWTFPYHPETELEYAELLDNGEIIGEYNGKGIVKIDKNSNIIWVKNISAHHDIAQTANNTLLIPITGRLKLFQGRIVMFDSVLELSKNGEILKEWSTYENLEELQQYHFASDLDKENYSNVTGIKIIDKPTNLLLKGIRSLLFYGYYTTIGSDKQQIFSNKTLTQEQKSFQPPKALPQFLEKIKLGVANFMGIKKVYDYYRLNSLEILPDNPLAKTDSRFQAGNWLICFRQTNNIMILDKDSKEVVWSWGPGILDAPHMPTMLENGNILIFDNGETRGFSRIIELNPLTKEIVWKYQADPLDNFFSATRGSNQRLANNNTLISEADSGRVFEVTSDGEIVWEFFNFVKEGNKRKTIYRMMRFPEEEINSWLKQ